MDVGGSAGRNEQAYLRWAILLWLAVMSFICSGLVFRFSHRNVTPDYHGAVEKWIAGQSIFGGFHYFPQFIFLFWPFHALPAPWGDVIWRLLSSGLLAWGMWRLVGLIDARRTSELLLFGSLIIMIPSFDALRNGQANVIFAAFTIHAAVCLSQSRWNAATAWLLLALVAKPIGIVTILLALLVYRNLIWRVAVGIVPFLLFPFVFGRVGYVWSQYLDSIRHLRDLSVISENRFADLNGLLRKLGLGLTGKASQAARVVAGLFTAITWWLGSRRIRPPEQACLLLGLATTYLMLFNPMTEENSYVIVLPAMAYFALRLLLIEGSPILGWGLIAAGVSIGVLPEPLRRVVPDFGLWWRPIVMLIFGGFLMGLVFGREGEAARVAELSRE